MHNVVSKTVSEAHIFQGRGIRLGSAEEKPSSIPGIFLCPEAEVMLSKHLVISRRPSGTVKKLGTARRTHSSIVQQAWVSQASDSNHRLESA